MFKEHTFLDMIRESYYKVLESNSNFSNSPRKGDVSPSRETIIVTSDMLSKWYSLFNKWYFDNKLPTVDKLQFVAEYFMGEKFVGQTYGLRRVDEEKIIITPTKICYNLSIPTHEEMFMNVLLHEMIHVLDYVYYSEHFLDENYDPHGDFFMNHATRINAYGWDITKTCGEDISKISTKENKYDGLLKKLSILRNDIDYIVDDTINLFLFYLSNLTSCVVLKDYTMVDNFDMYDITTLKSFNKIAHINIKTGIICGSDVTNMFKDEVELTFRTGEKYRYLMANEELLKIIKEMIRETAKGNDITNEVLMEKYGDILKKSYKELINMNFNRVENIIKILKEKKNISEDIDEEDYDTMHHDIYDEAERLKKIADRAGNGKVKIIDNKTIEFSIE